MAETDETYSAKQVASRIGTDAKTFRKWLRSDASPYPAVGQGQRYDFPKGDLPRIKKFFDAWKSRSTARKVTAPVNGHTRINTEPGDHRPIPYIASGPDTRPINQAKLKQIELKREIAAREAARDEEYGTVDGEEPTPEELDEIELEETED